MAPDELADGLRRLRESLGDQVFEGIRALAEERLEGGSLNDFDPADGWELHHWWTHDQRISLKPAAEAGLAEAAKKLRGSFPELREKTPSELLRELREMGCVSLGIVSSKEAWKMREIAASLQLEVLSEGLSKEHWFPVNRVTGMASMIDCDEESDRVARMMLQAGANVVEAEMD